MHRESFPKGSKAVTSEPFQTSPTSASSASRPYRVFPSRNPGKKASNPHSVPAVPLLRPSGTFLRRTPKNAQDPFARSSPEACPCSGQISADPEANLAGNPPRACHRRPQRNPSETRSSPRLQEPSRPSPERVYRPSSPSSQLKASKAFRRAAVPKNPGRPCTQKYRTNRGLPENRNKIPPRRFSANGKSNPERSARNREKKARSFPWTKMRCQAKDSLKISPRAKPFPSASRHLTKRASYPDRQGQSRACPRFAEKALSQTLPHRQVQPTVQSSGCRFHRERRRRGNGPL